MENLQEQLEEPYKIEQIIGHNDFLGIDEETKESVSIILVTHLFPNISDASRILNYLYTFSKLDHENIIKLKNLKKNLINKDSIFVITETLESNLYQLVKCNVELIEVQRQFFLYQILRALKYLHSINIIMKDLNTGQIEVNSNCEIKIQFFDLAKIDDCYCISRYKAPELYLAPENASFSCDIWSVGCILFELLMKKKLFEGNSTLDMLQKFVDAIGNPKDDDLFYVKNPKTIELMDSIKKVGDSNIDNLLQNASSDEIDLFKSMIKWNPTKRISVEEALNHPYFKKFHDPLDEPSAPEIEPLNIKLNKSDFREKFWNEIQRIKENNNFK